MVLAFLPFVNRDRGPPDWQRRMKLAGDLIGVVIALRFCASLLIPLLALTRQHDRRTVAPI